jgi:hypothetical protein
MNDTKCKIVDSEVREKYVLHKFTLTDVENLEIYAAQPIYEWQQTPEGKFCMEKATDIEWHTYVDHEIFGHRVVITGYLSGKHATFWALKKS